VHDGVIQCPWHGSEFCLRDGAVFRGPAASPEPAYATRVRGGLVEIRRGLAEVIDLNPVLV
jgi:nitrite reductase/ring-hydroxylating ferredoxin subunit